MNNDKIEETIKLVKARIKLAVDHRCCRRTPRTYAIDSSPRFVFAAIKSANAAIIGGMIRLEPAIPIADMQTM